MLDVVLESCVVLAEKFPVRRACVPYFHIGYLYSDPR